MLCALTVACYDNQARKLGRGLPELWLPEDEFAVADVEPGEAQLVRREGWIYFPKVALRDRARRDPALGSGLRCTGETRL